MKWRWDQGRLDYFQVDEIKHLAKALVAFEGHALPRGDDPDTLRTLLESYSERPFLPEKYKVWRNYKRVFGCQLLATDIRGIVVCTDLCRQIAVGDFDGDEYLINIARRFYYPSPVFDDYKPSGPQVFAICAIIKLLVAEFVSCAKPFISVDEIIDRLKGNPVDGTENLHHYEHLKNTGTTIPNGDDEYRQIREMLRFISQLSFLKWENPNLYLDVATPDAAIQIANLLSPIMMPRDADSARELLQIGGVVETEIFPAIIETESLNPFDIEFTEGTRARKTHLRVERSSKLKELYFKYIADPHHCDMCDMDTRGRYPWADRLVELHHVLPLSSPIRVESGSTSLHDIVGLCPSCHRATHKYYSSWLRDRGQKDFLTHAEARDVYGIAKSAIVI